MHNRKNVLRTILDRAKTLSEVAVEVVVVGTEEAEVVITKVQLPRTKMDLVSGPISDKAVRRSEFI